MGRWSKKKSFAPPVLQGFKKKEGTGPVFNFSDQLIDAIDHEKSQDREEFGGHFNDAFSDLDEYGFTLRRRDTSGDITFRPAGDSAPPAGDTLHSLGDLDAFGTITTAHVVEKYDSNLEISEDKETGEKNVLYEVHSGATTPEGPGKTMPEGPGNNHGKEGVTDSKQAATPEKTSSVDNRYSMDLDELYVETHLPEREIPVKKSKKILSRKGSKKASKSKKRRAPSPPRPRSPSPPDVIDRTADSPFVRAFRPASVVSASSDANTGTYVTENSQSARSGDRVAESAQSGSGVTHLTMSNLALLPVAPLNNGGSFVNTLDYGNGISDDHVVNVIPNQSENTDVADSNFPSDEFTHVTDVNPQEDVDNNNVKDYNQLDLPQVHSNGYVHKETNNNNSNVALPYNPNHINIDIEGLDDDLQPITGSPASQIFQSNVSRLSAHKLAILGSQNRSSKFKRGNPVERRIIRNSLRETQEIMKLHRKEKIQQMMYPSRATNVPGWARKRSEDHTLKYTIIGVVVFLVLAAVCVPLLWHFTGSSDSGDNNVTSTVTPSTGTTTTPSDGLVMP